MERTPVSQRRVPKRLVPQGHVIVSDRLLGSPLYEALKGGGIKVLVEDHLHHIDCYPSSDMGVMFLKEDLVVTVNDNVSLRKALDKLSKSPVTGVVIVECTPSSQPFFSDVQTLLVFEYGLKVIPVDSTEEAARMIVQLVKKSQSTSNPFSSTKPLPPPDPLVFQAVQLLPRTGSTTAKQLLQKFESLQGIVCASEQELSEATGKANALAISRFSMAT